MPSARKSLHQSSQTCTTSKSVERSGSQFFEIRRASLSPSLSVYVYEKHIYIFTYLYLYLYLYLHLYLHPYLYLYLYLYLYVYKHSIGIVIMGLWVNTFCSGVIGAPCHSLIWTTPNMDCYISHSSKYINNT